MPIDARPTLAKPTTIPISSLKNVDRQRRVQWVDAGTAKTLPTISASSASLAIATS